MIGTLVAERVLDVVVLFSLYAVLAVALRRGDAVGRPLRVRGDRPSCALALVVALVAVVGCTAGATSRGCGRSSSRCSPPRANLRGRHGAEALASTLAVWAVEAGVWLCCADAAGLHVSALEALYLLALASLFVFIPAGPGNVGNAGRGGGVRRARDRARVGGARSRS